MLPLLVGKLVPSGAAADIARACRLVELQDSAAVALALAGFQDVVLLRASAFRALRQRQGCLVGSAAPA
eukprot:6120100-Pyramimonas_sp.AAC.1